MNIYRIAPAIAALLILCVIYPVLSSYRAVYSELLFTRQAGASSNEPSSLPTVLQTSPSSVFPFSVDTHHSAEHPTCLGCVHYKSIHHSQPLEKSHKDCGCYKHGGHYNPGYPRDKGTYLTLHNVIWFEGKIYAEISTPRKLYYSGHFTMVSGNWPQLVVNEVEVLPLSELPASPMNRTKEADVAYLQPPTDFLSVYHVQVETTLPMWHRLLDRIISGTPTFAFTSRPKHTRYGFKPQSCHEGAVCLQTLWGKMYTMALGGPSYLVGLEKDPISYRVRSLRVGNPTHCEPLWGPDAWYTNVTSTSLLPMLPECHNLFSQFKMFYAKAAGVIEPLMIPIGPQDLGRILFVSRRGAWARHIVNEEELLVQLRAVYPGLVDVIQFKGNLTEQLVPLTSTGVMIAGHGAGLFQSIYLRPGAGIVTLSLYYPGFYPLVTIPKGLFWEDVLCDQICNLRLWKGKCKLSQANNNDVKMTPRQMQEALLAVERIRKRQAGRPR